MRPFFSKELISFHFSSLHCNFGEFIIVNELKDREKTRIKFMNLYSALRNANFQSCSGEGKEIHSSFSPICLETNVKKGQMFFLRHRSEMETKRDYWMRNNGAFNGKVRFMRIGKTESISHMEPK